MLTRTYTIRIIFLLAAAAWSLVHPSHGAEQVLTLDPHESEITFELDATAHTVRGALRLESGAIRFDLDTGVAAGEVVIDARRAETGNRKRDRAMHGKVLETDRYPRIVFDVRRVEGEWVEPAAGELELSGTLSFHGAEHPVSMTASVRREDERVFATASLVVPYVEWGLHQPNLLLLRVAPEVTVRIAARGSLGEAD